VAQPVFTSWGRFGVSSLATALRWLPLSVRHSMVQLFTQQAPDSAMITADRLLQYACHGTAWKDGGATTC